jgi:hypothetical protein
MKGKTSRHIFKIKTNANPRSSAPVSEVRNNQTQNCNSSRGKSGDSCKFIRSGKHGNQFATLQRNQLTDGLDNIPTGTVPRPDAYQSTATDSRAGQPQARLRNPCSAARTSDNTPIY